MSRKYGDIHFYAGKYFIGRDDSPSSGSSNSMIGRTLEYLLENKGRKVPEGELKKVTGSQSPLNHAFDLRNQLRYSKEFTLDVLPKRRVIKIGNERYVLLRHKT